MHISSTPWTESEKVLFWGFEIIQSSFFKSDYVLRVQYFTGFNVCIS